MMKKLRSRKWTRILIIDLVCLIGIQFIRPRLDNPTVTGDLQAPPEVKQIIKRACYDCHSNETKLAWFDELAPAYWMVTDDIKEAREVLNFSQWDSLPKEQQKGKLFEAFNKIVFKEMPLKSYRLLHAGATITKEEEGVIQNYLNTLVTPVNTPDSAKTNAAADQYEKWIAGSKTERRVEPSPNGIEFMPDYKNWTAISTTDRFDNGTMRVILGNDVAVKAIKERHTHPWPDGTLFAKVAWDQAIDSTGIIHTGVFKQVEFMIKESRKYASSDGWGWARWLKGTQLVPYGKNALFVTECMNCHKPMQDRDFVFTSPLDLALESKGDIGKVISSIIDRNNQTMATLYGNDIAVQFARTNSGQNYPAGAILSLVSWSQKEDKNWYGGKIPASRQSIDRLGFGPGLRKIEMPDSAAGKKREAYITNLRASVMP